MFGYATDETEEAMPLTLQLAHHLNAKLRELRENGTFAWARPDSKTQVIFITFLLLIIILGNNRIRLLRRRLCSSASAYCCSFVSAFTRR